MESFELKENKPQKFYSKTRLFLIINSQTPIVIKVPVSPELVTLKFFREATSLEKDYYKFYFRSKDLEFGSIKEEVVDDESYLPYEDDKIVAWVISLQNQSKFQVIPSIVDNEVFSPEKPNVSNTYRNIKVNLHLDQFNFLGLTLFSRSPNKNRVESGLFIADIAKHSIVEQNGLIEIGDKLVEINDIKLEELAEKTAISTIQNIVKKRGAITIEVSRRRNDVHLGNQCRLSFKNYLPNPFIHSSEEDLDDRLTDINLIYSYLRRDIHSLNLKNYDWLGVMVTDAFLGSSLMAWLRRNVPGSHSKKEMRRFAQSLLKSNYIRSPFINTNFSERCFYTLN